MLPQRLAERLPGHCVVGGELLEFLGSAHAPGGDVKASSVDRRHHGGEAVSHPAQDPVRPNPAVIERKGGYVVTVPAELSESVGEVQSAGGGVGNDRGDLLSE